LWNGLVKRYDRGVEQVQGMQEQWTALGPLVDARRHAEVAANLRAQHMEAMWWRDASVSYWQSLNGLPLPAGHPLPAHSLTYYKTIRFEDLPGDP
jgi:alpha-glucuronidase